VVDNHSEHLAVGGRLRFILHLRGMHLLHHCWTADSHGVQLNGCSCCRWVRCLAFDHGNEWFVTGSADRTIKVFYLILS
jgi:WD40 repeat protein